MYTRNDISTDLKQVYLDQFICYMRDISQQSFPTKWACLKKSERANIDYSDVFLEVVILSNSSQSYEN